MTTERFEARVGANIREFERKMDQVNRTMHELATGVSVEIDLMLSEFYAGIARVQSTLSDLEAERVSIEIDAALNDFMRDLLQVRALAQELDGRNIRLDVKADTSHFMRGVARVNAVAKALSLKNIVIKIWADYTNAMKSYANTVQAFAEAGQQILMGSLLVLIPTLSQLLSVLVGLIGSLGVMIGVLAGQFMILASAVSVTALGFVGLAAVAIPTIKNLFDETAQLTAEQQRAKSSWDAFKATYDDLVKATEQPVLEGFTSAMSAANKILQSFEPLVVSVANSAAKLMDAFDRSIDSAPIQKIFDTFNKYGSDIFENMVTGIGYFTAAIGSMLAAFTPAAATWSKGFNDMMKSFAGWADGLTGSERFMSFVDYIQTYMPVISDIFGNLVVGIVEFFSAFSGMGGDFMTGLQAMTEQFQTWASTLGENQEFQRFLAFIQASTPAVLELLGNLWNLIVNLGIAFAPIGAIVLDLTNKFLAWFNSMLQAEGVFATLVALFPVALGVISALAPVIISIVSIFGNLWKAIDTVIPYFSNFQKVIWQVYEFAGKVWSVISKLGSVFAWLTTPVGLAVAAIGLIIAAVILAYNKVDWFRDLVDTAWNAIKEATSKAFTAVYETISSAISKVVEFGKKILGEFEKFWEKHGDTITTIVKTAFEMAYEIIAGIMKTIGTVIETAWNIITGIFSIAWDLITGIIQIAIDLILGIVSAGMSLLQGDWESAWDTIVETAESIGESIVDTLGSIIDSVWQIGVDIISGLISGITSMFDSVAKALGKLTDKIPSWVKDALGIHSPSRVMAAIAKWIPIGIAKGITDNINSVHKATNAMTDATMPNFSKTIQASEMMLKEVSRVSEKYTKENVATRLEEFEKALNEQKKWYDIGAGYEYSYWKEVSNHLQAGTAAKRKALENANAAYEQLMQEQYETEVNFIDKATAYNALSLTDRIQAYEQYMKQYEIGSKQQIAYEEKLYDAKKELYDGLKTLADDYLSKMQTVYDKLADEEQKLRDQFQQTYDSRVQTIKDTWGLFDEVSLTQMVEYDEEGNVTKQKDLLQNMRDQVTTLSSWMNDIFALESRGLSEGLISELQQLGPSVAAEVKALTRMTQAELSEYQTLWETKTALANAQATKELEGARLAMEAEVAKLHENATKELEALTESFKKEVQKLRYGTEDEFDIMTATLPEIGVQAVQGLMNGMKSMSGRLKSLASSMAEDIKRTLETVLDVEGAAGAVLSGNVQLTDAVKNQYSTKSVQSVNTKVVDETEFAEPQIALDVYNQWNGEEVETWLDTRSATNFKLKTFSKG